MITLRFDDNELDLTKGSYKEALGSVENQYVSEAGTNIRDVIRTGIYGLNVTYKGTEVEKIILDAAVQKNQLDVTVWDEKTSDYVSHQMYIDASSYSASLLSEDEHHRYYELSFSLKEL